MAGAIDMRRNPGIGPSSITCEGPAQSGTPSINVASPVAAPATAQLFSRSAAHPASQNGGLVELHMASNVAAQRFQFRETDMSRGMPSMTALLGLLALAGYQNRDKLGELLKGVTGNDAQPGAGNQQGPLGGLLGNLGGALGRWRRRQPAKWRAGRVA